MKKIYKVYIVGAGPGDPELLTLKAYRLLTAYADLVVYDRLIPKKLLNLIPKNVEKIYAGKSCRKHHMTQDEINAELVAQAKTGKKIVRLKGGDPFIFGRGGEEAEYLKKSKIPFEVVSGISAASGISAHLGVPLTHRGMATGVRFITGHQQKKKPVKLDWKGLADPDTTLVLYMGLAHLEEAAENLIKRGLSEKTPAVAIQEGTTENEKVCTGNLKNLAAKMKKRDFAPPTIVIIGKVVAFAKKLGNLKDK